MLLSSPNLLLFLKRLMKLLNKRSNPKSNQSPYHNLPKMFKRPKRLRRHQSPKHKKLKVTLPEEAPIATLRLKEKFQLIKGLRSMIALSITLFTSLVNKAHKRAIQVRPLPLNLTTYLIGDIEPLLYVDVNLGKEVGTQRIVVFEGDTAEGLA